MATNFQSSLDVMTANGRVRVVVEDHILRLENVNNPALTQSTDLRHHVEIFDRRDFPTDVTSPLTLTIAPRAPFANLVLQSMSPHDTERAMRLIYTAQAATQRRLAEEHGLTPTFGLQAKDVNNTHLNPFNITSLGQVIGPTSLIVNAFPQGVMLTYETEELAQAARDRMNCILTIMTERRAYFPGMSYSIGPTPPRSYDTLGTYGPGAQYGTYAPYVAPFRAPMPFDTPYTDYAAHFRQTKRHVLFNSAFEKSVQDNRRLAPLTVVLNMDQSDVVRWIQARLPITEEQAERLEEYGYGPKAQWLDPEVRDVDPDIEGVISRMRAGDSA